MARFAALLVHGYSGSPRDLAPLAETLAGRFGADSVEALRLPGHGDGAVPERFERKRLVAAVAEALRRLRQQSDCLLVLGHSTGGSLLLAALAETGIVPELTVLAAVPYGIDLAYLERWQQHRASLPAIDLSSVAALVAMINASGSRGPAYAMPVLLLQGEDDLLVVREEAHCWQRKLAEEPRLVLVPDAGHQLFAADAAVAAVMEAADALVTATDQRRERFARELLESEPEAARFFAGAKERLVALADCPSGRRLAGVPVATPEFVPWCPAFANIEITTRCNLACRYCARSLAPSQERDMAPADFARILEKLPSAYRVTLVGLGEPLLHPQLVELVALAKVSGRRIGLVTNAQLLEEGLGRRLLESGLDSIAFSLDTVDPEMLDLLRPGSDLARVEANIRAFNSAAAECGRPVGRAVFAAVSQASLAGLERLVEHVSTLGVHVLMLSDLNFEQNQAFGLSEQVDAEMERNVRRAVSRGFALNLPVLGVRALEHFGLVARYRDSLLLPPRQLYRRSPRHTHCVSPWQTIPVNVFGEVTLCDCQPESVVGSLLKQDVNEIWNGELMRNQRRRILAGAAPVACRICPRF